MTVGDLRGLAKQQRAMDGGLADAKLRTASYARLEWRRSRSRKGMEREGAEPRKAGKAIKLTVFKDKYFPRQKKYRPKTKIQEYSLHET